MSSPIDVRAVARRALQRLRGEEAGPQGLTAAQPPAYQPPNDPRARSEGPPLVSAACLANTPDGGEFALAPDARVTPLARDEAFRRGIRLTPTRRGRALAEARVVAVASDHGGFALKEELLDMLRELGHRPLDLGPSDDASVDYPDYAERVADAVAAGRAAFGVCVDGAGIGSAMAACKVPGVLAANCWDERTARNAREHNHANVLTLGAGHLDRSAARAVLVAFLTTPVGGDRHARRANKILAIEARHGRRPATGAQR